MMNYDRRGMNRFAARAPLEVVQAMGWPPLAGGAQVSGVIYSLGEVNTGDWQGPNRVAVGSGDGGGQTMFP